MPEQGNNPNQVGEAVIPVKVTGLEEAERDIRKMLDNARQLAAGGVQVGVGAGGGGGTSVPGGSPGGGTTLVPQGTPPMPSSPMPKGTGAATAAGGTAPATRPAFTAGGMGMAVGAGVIAGVAIDDALVRVEEARRRLDIFEFQTGQAGVDAGFLRSRRIRDTRIAGQVAAGVPEFIARGGRGGNEQAAMDRVLDERRALENEDETLAMEQVTGARFGVDAAKDLLLVMPDFLRGEVGFNRTFRNVEAYQKNNIARRGIAQRLRGIGADAPNEFAAARQLDMLILMQESLNEAAGMRLEMRR